MPLAPGSDQATISKNISELTHHGSIPRPHKQIVAIALANADRHPHKDAGGGVDLSYTPQVSLDRRPPFGGPPDMRRESEEPPLSVEGEAGHRQPAEMRATYRKSIGFEDGGHIHEAFGGGFHLSGLGKAPGSGIPAVHVPQMSASQESPWWERSSAHMATPKGIGKFDEGGATMSASQESPWWTRSQARQDASGAIPDFHMNAGLIPGSGAGRTDRVPLSLQNDSHVLTADSVSGAGQHSTNNGWLNILQALRVGPYGVPDPTKISGKGPPSHTPPREPSGLNIATGGIVHEAAGGDAHDNHNRVSILGASSEGVIPNDDFVARDPVDGQHYLHRGVRSLGRDWYGQKGLRASEEQMIKKGHQLLDQMTENIRKFNIQWLKSAPKPKKSIGGAIVLAM